MTASASLCGHFWAHIRPGLSDRSRPTFWPDLFQLTRESFLHLQSHNTPRNRSNYNYNMDDLAHDMMMSGYELPPDLADSRAMLEIHIVHLQDTHERFCMQLDTCNELIYLIKSSPKDRESWETHGLDIVETYAAMLDRRASDCIAQLMATRAKRDMLVLNHGTRRSENFSDLLTSLD